MFSRRTSWLRRPNRLALRLEELRAAGAPLLDLTISNPTQAGIAYPSGQLRQVLSPEEALVYRPDPLGLPAARAAIAGYYARKNVLVDPANILLTSGSSEAYTFLFRLLCEPGDVVLVPTPSYPLFDYLADLSDIQAFPYGLAFDGSWHTDVAAVRAALTPAVRAILAVHPNNPTGSFLSLAARDELATAANTAGAALIVDEVFLDYAFGPDPQRAPSLAAFDRTLTFTINGLSKTAGLPQMKLGWLTVSGPSGLVREAMARLEVVADTFLSVNTPVQCATPDLLRLGEEVFRAILARTMRNLKTLREVLSRDSSCSLLPVEGGWYATLRVPATRSDEAWALHLLEEAAVVVQPGFFYDMTGGGHLVVSLLTPEAEFAEGFGKLLRAVDAG
jgi:alanine-synthesizing transaminase